MNHGFVSRGDIKQPDVYKSYRDVMVKTFKFMNKFLKK